MHITGRIAGEWTAPAQRMDLGSLKSSRYTGDMCVNRDGVTT
jgi:hypothetical protein